MSSSFSSDEIASAVIQNVQNGSYPEVEGITSASLSPSTFPRLISGLNKSKEDAKREVRLLSHDAGTDVDDWIAQAKKVQADIERSQAIAREIILEGGSVKAHRAGVDDASNKVRLLKTELAFNDTLADTLNRTQSIATTLEEVEQTINDGHLVRAMDRLDTATEAAKELSRFENARFVNLLHDRIARQGATLRESVLKSWDQSVRIDSHQAVVEINASSPDKLQLDPESLAHALKRLLSLDDTVSKFVGSFRSIIIRPSLASRSNQNVVREANRIYLKSQAEKKSAAGALSDVRKTVQYLSEVLPAAVYDLVSEQLGTDVVSQLLDNWLRPSLPTKLAELEGFQNILVWVTELCQFLHDARWTKSELLSEWVEESPRHWLSLRKEAALAKLRTVAFEAVKRRRLAEHVETQLIADPSTFTASEGVVQESQTNVGQSAEESNEWDAAWDDEGDALEPTVAKENDDEDEEEEDGSAWDTNDPGEEEEVSHGPPENRDENTSNNEEEAWGWGDDEKERNEVSRASHVEQHPPQTNGNHERPKERQITLKENYVVTGIPDTIHELISETIVDAETLLQPPYNESSISAAAVGLYSIPALLIAMYRATAATHYANDVAGNMLMYNDSICLCDLLQDLLATQAHKDQTSSVPTAKQATKRLRLENDINLISAFGKRAYGREMHSQRTILGDLLDGAQGFSNCTTQPFARECDQAVAITVERIRSVNAGWKGVLSPSAQLQSLGNLVSTVMAKMTVQIEDMSDIGEAESGQLKKYCDQVAQLSDLFAQTAPDGSGEEHNTVQVYVSEWFRFQYLGQILESSLVDIKYLWQEGELSLEFEPEEVVDLIEALFAQSDHRRSAVAEIRRSGRRNDLF